MSPVLLCRCGIFELYNKFSIHNWYYVGLPDVLLIRVFGYIWSFATITPAIFESADLVSSLRDRRADPSRTIPPHRHPLSPAAWTAVIAGAGMVLLPTIRPIAI